MTNELFLNASNGILHVHGTLQTQSQPVCLEGPAAASFLQNLPQQIPIKVYIEQQISPSLLEKMKHRQLEAPPILPPELTNPEEIAFAKAACSTVSKVCYFVKSLHGLGKAAGKFKNTLELACNLTQNIPEKPSTGDVLQGTLKTLFDYGLRSVFNKCLKASLAYGCRAFLPECVVVGGVPITLVVGASAFLASEIPTDSISFDHLLALAQEASPFCEEVAASLKRDAEKEEKDILGLRQQIGTFAKKIFSSAPPQPSSIPLSLDLTLTPRVPLHRQTNSSSETGSPSSSTRTLLRASFSWNVVSSPAEPTNPTSPFIVHFPVIVSNIPQKRRNPSSTVTVTPFSSGSSTDLDRSTQAMLERKEQTQRQDIQCALGFHPNAIFPDGPSCTVPPGASLKKIEDLGPDCYFYTYYFEGTSKLLVGRIARWFGKAPPDTRRGEIAFSSPSLAPYMEALKRVDPSCYTDILFCAMYEKTQQHYQSGDISGCQQFGALALKIAQKMDPSKRTPMMTLFLAQSAAGSQDYEKSISLFEHYRKSNPKDLEVLKDLASVHLAAKNSTAARATIEQWISLSQSPLARAQSICFRADLDVQDGQVDRALHDLEEEIKRIPLDFSSLPIYVKIVESAWAKSDFPTAFKYLMQCTSLHPTATTTPEEIALLRTTLLFYEKLWLQHLIRSQTIEDVPLDFLEQVSKRFTECAETARLIRWTLQEKLASTNPQKAYAILLPLVETETTPNVLVSLHTKLADLALQCSYSTTEEIQALSHREIAKSHLLKAMNNIPQNANKASLLAILGYLSLEEASASSQKQAADHFEAASRLLPSNKEFLALSAWLHMVLQDAKAQAEWTNLFQIDSQYAGNFLLATSLDGELPPPLEQHAPVPLDPSFLEELHKDSGKNFFLSPFFEQFPSVQRYLELEFQKWETKKRIEQICARLAALKEKIHSLTHGEPPQ